MKKHKILKKSAVLILVLLLMTSVVSVASAVNPTPSTNDTNRTNGWAHVNELSVGVGEVELEFVSTRTFASCFEYRTDGDTSQSSGDNYNLLITDGLYPFYCQNNSTSVHTILANEYVEIRMVFGAESDERFDWIRFDVLPTPVSLPQPKVVFGAWLGFADDMSWCALKSPMPNVGVITQGLLCFPDTNPSWVATKVYYTPVYDNNYWYLDIFIDGSQNRLDFLEWLEK